MKVNNILGNYKRICKMLKYYQNLEVLYYNSHPNILIMYVMLFIKFCLIYYTIQPVLMLDLLIVLMENLVINSGI